MDLKLFLLLVTLTLSAGSSGGTGTDNWNCPCHLCKRILSFAITILPSCPEPKILDQVFDLSHLCHESSLADVSQECIHFVKKFYRNNVDLQRALLKLQCFSRTEIEIEALCGHHHLGCCESINEL